MKVHSALVHAAVLMGVSALLGCSAASLDQDAEEMTEHTGTAESAATGVEVLDQSQTSYDDGVIMIWDSDQIAQVFTPTQTGFLTHFSVAAFPCPFTRPCGFTLTVRRVDDSGQPAQILWSGRGRAPAVPDSGEVYGWTTMSLAAPPLVRAGIQYALAISPDSWMDFTLSYGNRGYTLVHTPPHVAWSNLDSLEDLMFKTWITPVDPPVTYAFKTWSGGFLSVVNGGGLGGPNSGPGSVALHTDAISVGLWESFTWVWVDQAQNKFALRTASNNYITAVNGGGMGGPNDSSCPVHTDAMSVGPWERLTIEQQPDGRFAIVTPSGFYVSAVNAGGFGGPNDVPIHTDTTVLGTWETLTLVTP